MTRRAWIALRPDVRCVLGPRFSTDRARHIFDLLESESGHERVIHATPKRRTSVLDVAVPGAPQKVVVKELRRAGFMDRLKGLFRASPGARAWRSLVGVFQRGVRVPVPYALIEDRRRGSAYVLMEFLDGWRRPDLVLTEDFPARPDGSGRRRKRMLLDAVVDAFRNLHEAGIYLSDSIAYNVMVREQDGRWEVAMIDVDAAAFSRKLSLSRRLRSLAKLDASLRDRVSRTERWRSLKRYAAGDPRFLTRRSVRRILAIRDRRIAHEGKN